MKRTAITAIVLMAAASAQAADTEAIMTDITAGLKGAKQKWELAGETLCNNPNSCAIYVGPFLVSAIGSSVEVMVSSQDTPQKYAKVCSAVLAGIMRAKASVASSYIDQGFQDASLSGSAKYQIGHITIDIKSSGDSRLECNFVKTIR